MFHKIIKGEIPCYKVWEDEKHLAFLSIFPNTEGVTVVVPKEYSPSYFAECPDEVIADLIVAAKKVAKLLDKKLDDVGRTGLVLEGFGVNYLHAKLFPLHGTKSDEWKAIKSTERKYFEKYQGFICSNDFEKASGEELERVRQKITS